MTTDDLLQIIPQTETTEWEFKSAAIFDPARFNEFKKQKLGRIVSSFANSGGGFLLLGKQDGVPVFEPVRTHEGRTTMEDHLSLVISQSVTPHYREFSVHRVPISGKPGESVLVVAFGDSFAAPHQSVVDVNYFYRLPGHSVPAPHFHLELLRNRVTRTVLKISGSDYDFVQMRREGQFIRVVVALKLMVENTSLQSANSWGVHLKHFREFHSWKEETKNQDLGDGVFISGPQQTLLPTESVTVSIRLLTDVYRSINDWENLGVIVRPISHNHVGTEYLWRACERWPIDRRRFEEAMERFGLR